MRKNDYEQWKKRLVDSAKASKIPLMGQFELTGRCNLGSIRFIQLGRETVKQFLNL